MRGFKLTGNATLQLEVKGVKNTDKGFDVYLMTAADYEKFAAGKEFKHFPAFQGLKITGATNTKDIPAGEYAIVLHNKYNLLKGMIVRAVRGCSSTVSVLSAIAVGKNSNVGAAAST